MASTTDIAKKRVQAESGWRTSDGQFWRDQDKAVQHETDLLIRESLLNLVGLSFYNGCDAITIAEGLFEHRDKLKNLFK